MLCEERFLCPPHTRDDRVPISEVLLAHVALTPATEGFPLSPTGRHPNEEGVNRDTEVDLARLQGADNVANALAGSLPNPAVFPDSVFVPLDHGGGHEQPWQALRSLRGEWTILDSAISEARSGMNVKKDPSYKCERLRLRYVFQLDESPPDGYTIFYNDRPNHHTLAPPEVDTVGTVTGFGANGGDYIKPKDDSPVQNLKWTLVGLEITASAEPRENEGGDDDTYFVARMLYDHGPSLSTDGEEMALELAADVERLKYPKDFDLAPNTVTTMISLLHEIKLACPDADVTRICAVITNLEAVQGGNKLLASYRAFEVACAEFFGRKPDPELTDDTMLDLLTNLISVFERDREPKPTARRISDEWPHRVLEGLRVHAHREREAGSTHTGGPIFRRLMFDPEAVFPSDFYDEFKMEFDFLESSAHYRRGLRSERNRGGNPDPDVH